MKKYTLVSLFFLMALLLSPQTAQAARKIRVIVSASPSSPSLFPIVCYFISMRADIRSSIQEETMQSSSKTGLGATAPLSVKYKDGITLPQYWGYIVVNKGFHIENQSKEPDPHRDKWIQQFNSTPSLVRHAFFPPTHDLGWSWRELRERLHTAGAQKDFLSMALTFGEPPDPNYIPQVKQTKHVPFEFFKNAQGERGGLFPPEIDATIINLKPDMHCIKMDSLLEDSVEDDLYTHREKKPEQ